MKYKFEFNHKTDNFTKSIPSTMDPIDITSKLREIISKDVSSKSEMIESIINTADPQTPNDILVLGIAFGATHAMERFSDPSAGLPPPIITESIIAQLMRAAYGKETGTWSIDEEKVEKHIKQEKHDF